MTEQFIVAEISKNWPEQNEPEPAPWSGTRWRHQKRGTVYELVGRGNMQTAEPIPDGHEVAIYRSVDNGRLWVRPTAEFFDGRFEQVSHKGMRRLLAERFEDVINHNLQRGYRLHSWKLNRISRPDPDDPDNDAMNETIIAIFELSP